MSDIPVPTRIFPYSKATPQSREKPAPAPVPG
jgi:hypothetical protein